MQLYIGGQGSFLQASDLEFLSEADLDAMIRALDPYLEPGDRAAPAKGPESQVGKMVSAALFYGLLLCLVAAAVLVSRGDKRPVFGYSLMNVWTGSMAPAMPPGSLVIIKRVDPAAIEIGDIVTYMKDAETSVTHRVIGITENFEGSGERGFETQGDDNGTPDFAIVPAVHIVGVVKAHVPKVGDWLEWLRGHLILAGGFVLGLVLLVFLLKGAFMKPPEEKRKKAKQSPRLNPAFQFTVKERRNL